MRYMRVGIALVVLAGWVQVQAEDEYEIKVYPCPRTAQAMVVDGRLDESAWQEAPLVSGFTLYNRPELMAPPTFFRVLHSSTHLYVGVTCGEPMMKRLVPVVAFRDAKSLFRGEVVEIFVDPRHDHETYYQFAVNAAASIFDGCGKDTVWNADVTAATVLGESEWVVELAIPWADLGVTPERDKVLGINVCRDRNLGRRQWANWAQTKGGFHKPAYFGHLVLSPTPRMLANLEDEFRKGDRTGAVAIYERGGYSGMTYREMAGNVLGETESRLDELRKVVRAEDDPMTRQALEKRIARVEKALQPMTDEVDALDVMDAAQWMRLAMKMDRIVLGLNDSIWTARLSALISRL